MHPRTPSRPLQAALAALATTAVAASAAVLLPSAVDAQTSLPRVYFGGQAYGSEVGVSSLVQSGKTASVPLCTPKVGAVEADRNVAVHLPGIGTIGAVTNRDSSVHAGRSVGSVTTSHTAKTRLLGGAILVRALNVRARESRTGTGSYRSAATTTLLGLTIAGHPMPVHPAANQTYRIPGLATIVLNQQSRSAHNGAHSLVVNALRVRLLPKNKLGLPTGSIVIGHTLAELHAPVHHNAYGSAYGTTIGVAGVARSGRTAPVYLGCGGSAGHEIVNRTAGAHVNGVLLASAVSSNARSTDTTSATTAVTRSRVAGVNLFGGMVRVHAVTVRSSVTRHGSHLTRSANGTSVLGLTVNGTTYGAPRLGTTRSVNGLGTFSFGATKRSGTGLQVYGLRLVLSTARDGLSKGTVITIGSAQAGVRS